MENGEIRIMRDARIPQFYQEALVREEYCGGSFPIRRALELIIKYLFSLCTGEFIFFLLFCYRHAYKA